MQAIEWTQSVWDLSVEIGLPQLRHLHRIRRTEIKLHTVSSGVSESRFEPLQLIWQSLPKDI